MTRSRTPALVLVVALCALTWAPATARAPDLDPSSCQLEVRERPNRAAPEPGGFLFSRRWITLDV